MYQENSVDDDLLNEGRRNLRDYLQTKGYFDAAVDVERQPGRSATTSTSFTPSIQGERHKLAAVKIDGNHYFDERPFANE